MFVAGPEPETAMRAAFDVPLFLGALDRHAEVRDLGAVDRRHEGPIRAPLSPVFDRRKYE